MTYLGNVIDDCEQDSGREEILFGFEIPERVDNGKIALQCHCHRNVN